jgi:hypothetical protein
MRLIWYGHNTFRLTREGVAVYVDPVAKVTLGTTTLEAEFDRPADAIVISSDSRERFDPQAIAGLVTPRTRIIAHPDVLERFPSHIPQHTSHAGDERIDFSSFTLETMDAPTGLSWIFWDRASKACFMGESYVVKDMLDYAPTIACFPLRLLTDEIHLEGLRELAKTTVMIPCGYHHNPDEEESFVPEESIGKVLEGVPNRGNLDIGRETPVAFFASHQQ